MNDEINRESVAIVFKASRFSADALQKAVNAYLNAQRRSPGRQRADPNKHGRMSVKELVGSGQGVTTVEVKDDDIKEFSKVAKKYNLDYAVKKDKNSEPPKYIVFFKGKDLDVITEAFKEFAKPKEEKDKDREKERPSLRERLKKSIEKSKRLSKNRDKVLEKAKSLERSL